MMTVFHNIVICQFFMGTKQFCDTTESANKSKE